MAGDLMCSVFGVGCDPKKAEARATKEHEQFEKTCNDKGAGAILLNRLLSFGPFSGSYRGMVDSLACLHKQVQEAQLNDPSFIERIRKTEEMIRMSPDRVLSIDSDLKGPSVPNSKR